MKSLFLTLICLISFAVGAQKKSSNPKPFAETITDADLKKLLYVVASKEMEGRETATAGQRKAAAYIEEKFKALNLLPGNQGNYQLQYPVFRDSLAGSRIIVNGKELELNKDFQPNIQFSNSGKQYFSEVTFAGYGLVDSTHNSYKSLNVSGKAVLILEGGPEGFSGGGGRFSPTSMLAKVANARDKGAAAVFLISKNLNQAAVGNMFQNIFKASQYPAVYAISENAAQLIAGDSWFSMKEKIKSDKNVKTPLKAEVQAEIEKRTMTLRSSNVLGVLEGTDKKDEYLVITAHYDHLGKRGDVIYYGADDDGSGTVSVIEIAEAFAKAKAAGKGPRRSILFMTVSGEEKGLWGSQYYATHPTITTEKITANLNIDMIGRVDTERIKPDTLNYVYVVGDDKLSSELKPLSEAMNKKYTNLVLDYKFNDPNDRNRIYFRSDHYNFARVGVPIIFYYDGMLKADYHQPTDTPDKINYKLMAKRAQLVFYTAWEMANRDTMMKRDIPLPKMER